MRISLRAIVVTLAISLTYGGFVIACPQWSRDLGLDVWNAIGENAELDAQKKHAKTLDKVSERVKKRLEMKEAVIEDLIDNRTNLEEATEQFLALNEMDPELTSYLRNHFAGANDQEKTANQVILFTKTMLTGDLSRMDEVSKRLDRELLAMKGRAPIDVVH